MAHNMETSLQKLENALRNHAPSVLDKLTRGLLQGQIDELAVVHDLILPDEINQLYRWRNGERGTGLWSMFGRFDMLSLDHAIEWSREFEDLMDPNFFFDPISYPELEQASSGVCFLTDSCGGDFFAPCYTRVVETTPVFFRSSDEASLTKCCESVSDFIVTLAASYEQNFYSVVDKYGSLYVETNYERLSELWRELNDGMSPFDY